MALFFPEGNPMPTPDLHVFTLGFFFFHRCRRARKPEFVKRAAFPSGGPAGPGHKLEGFAANNVQKHLRIDTNACAHVLMIPSSHFVDHFTLVLN